MTLAELFFGSRELELGTLELSRAQLQAAHEYTDRENDSAVIVSKTVVPAWLLDRERRAAALRERRAAAVNDGRDRRAYARATSLATD